METTEECIVRHLMDAEFALFELRNALDWYCFDELESKVEAFRQELDEEIKKFRGVNMKDYSRITNDYAEFISLVSVSKAYKINALVWGDSNTTYQEYEHINHQSLYDIGEYLLSDYENKFVDIELQGGGVVRFIP